MIVSWKQVALTCPDWYTCRYPSEKCPKNCWFPVGFPLNQGQKGLKRHAAGVGVVLNRSPLMAAWLSLAPASTPGRFLGVARWRNQRGMRGSRGWGMLNPSSRSCGGTRRIQGCDEKRSRCPIFCPPAMRERISFFLPLFAHSWSQPVHPTPKTANHNPRRTTGTARSLLNLAHRERTGHSPFVSYVGKLSNRWISTYYPLPKHHGQVRTC